MPNGNTQQPIDAPANSADRWYRRVGPVQLAAVSISLLMTVVAVLGDPMLNSDGVLYLLAAESIKGGDVRTALDLHGQPLYAMLIAATDRLLGIGMEPSAYVVNAMLQAALVAAFIAAVVEFEDTAEYAWLAAVVILSFTSFNEYRSEIVRGFGYWACLMLGIRFFLRYARTSSARSLAGGLLSLFAATLFRIEGLLLVMLMPLVPMLFANRTIGRRIAQVASIYALYLVSGGVLVAALTLSGESTSFAALIKPALDHVETFIRSMGEHFSAQAEAVKTHLLSRYSHDYAPAVIAMMILLVLVLETISTLGIVYGLSAIAAMKLGLAKVRANSVGVLGAFLAANLLVLLLFAVARGFLTGRYTLGFALTALILAPLGVRMIYAAVSQRLGGRTQVRVFGSLLVMIAAYMWLDGIISTSPGKSHEREAAHWLRENVDPSKRVLSFENTILYRAGRLDAQAYHDNLRRQRKVSIDGRTVLKSWQVALTDRGWSDYDYVVASIGRKRLEEQHEIEQIIGRAPLKVFENSRNDRVAVFAVDP